MLLTQVASAMALATVPVLATEIAREADVPASLVGAYSSLLFGFAMLSSLAAGGLIERVGPVRANQTALVLSALALLPALTASPWVIAAGAAALGFGYGPNTPSGSEVLARVTPAHQRPFVFSLKQSGAPLGAMAAGLVLPAVAVATDWRRAVVVAAVLVVAAAAAVQPLRHAIDRAAAPAPGRGGAAAPSPLAAMRTVLATPALRRLTAGSFLLMVLHGSFQAFTVAYLVEHVGLALTSAGAMFAVLSIAGSVSRIALGWAADRLLRARTLLVVLALGGAVASALTARLDGESPLPYVAAVCAAAGLGSAGWYGVFLAEVARLAPADRVGLATGGALFFVYGAILAGPSAFTLTVALAGGYPPAFWLLAALGVLAAGALARVPR